MDQRQRSCTLFCLALTIAMQSMQGRRRRLLTSCNECSMLPPVSDTRKFDRGLTTLLRDELHWLDVPLPERVTFTLTRTAVGRFRSLVRRSGTCCLTNSEGGGALKSQVLENASTENASTENVSSSSTISSKKERIAVNVYSHPKATGRHLPYGITQCYLPPDTSERALP